MSELSVFNFDSQSLRTITRNGEPWFVAADVCEVLTIANNRDAVARLDYDEKGVASIDTPGGQQEVTIINESGLYSLILTSRKPEAKRFKKWVTSEVLPTIRKTGSYASEHTLLKDQLLAAKDQIIDLQRQIMLSMQERKTQGIKKEKPFFERKHSEEFVFERVVSALKKHGILPSWKITRMLKMSKSETAPYLQTMQDNGAIVVTAHQPASGKTRYSVMLA